MKSIILSLIATTALMASASELFLEHSQEVDESKDSIKIITISPAMEKDLVFTDDRKPSPDDGTSAPATSSIEGTTWSGKDSDGDYHEYTFLKGGQLRFRTNTNGPFKTYEDKGDEWAQNGSIVLMVMSKFTTRQGRIVDGRLQGDAWNARGQRWTWMAEKK